MMIKRIHIYLKEMFPVIPRLSLSFLVVFEIYFLLLLNNRHYQFSIGLQEMICGLTVFGFLLMLRIADEFKDYEIDLKLFPSRPFPSGRVLAKDLKTLLVSTVSVLIVLNLLFMNNRIYFVLLFTYGLMMSLWFFQKAKIQNNLILALITHNPVQIFLNLYVISFTCIKYQLPMVNLLTLVLLFSFYFPALAWEVARKIRAPENETAYVTYSKVMGYKKATCFLMGILLLDTISSATVVFEISAVASCIHVIYCVIILFICVQFLRNPKRFSLIQYVEGYIYVVETTIVLIIVLFLIKNMVHL